MLKGIIIPILCNYIDIYNIFDNALMGGSTLSPNSSETGWNFQTPFYRIVTDSLRMVYVNFHKSICLRDFSGTATLIRGRVLLATMMARQKAGPGEGC